MTKPQMFAKLKSDFVLSNLWSAIFFIPARFSIRAMLKMCYAFRNCRNFFFRFMITQHTAFVLTLES